MAWLSSTSYGSGSAITNAIIENLAKDDRTWGGNVDGGGFVLTNCGGVYGPTGSNPLVFQTNGIERARITGAGLLGIGTNAPARIVDVRVGTSANSQNQVRCLGYQAAFEVENNAGTVNFYFGVDDADSNKLKIGGGYSPGQGITPAITVNASNYVGIGMASPTAPLQVAGVPVYANNAAAIAGGLTAGAFYRTGANPDPVCVVH